MIQNTWFAMRAMSRAPGLVVAATLALALGIGANTAIFTVINAVLLVQVPYENPDELVVLVRTRESGPTRGVSIPKFLQWKDSADDMLADMAVYDSAGPGISLSYEGEPEHVKAIRVSQNFFSLFRVKPAFGRFFTPEEDRPGGGRVAVLSHGLWTRRFGADPRLIGNTVSLNGEPHTIVGIAMSGYVADPPADVWLALQADPGSMNQAHFLLGAARLKPGVTVNAANARLKVVAEDFRRRLPNAMAKDESAGTVSMREAVSGDIRPTLLIVFGAVVLVQLIACANVANMLLVRSVGRAKEMTVRTCLGATRGNLIVQLLIESVLLALIGGIFGILLGYSGLQLLSAWTPPEIPRLGELIARGGLDPTVVRFTLTLSLLSGVLFGLAPALRLSRADLNSALGSCYRGTSQSVGHLRIQSVIVVCQLALSLVLLVGAGLLVRSALLLNDVNPGFRSDDVLAFKTPLNAVQYSTTAAVTQYRRTLVERLESLPGVQASAYVSFLPTERSPDLSFAIEGHSHPAGEGTGSGRWRFVSHRLFEVLGIPLIRGRVFRENDTVGSAAVVVINETMARKYWPQGNPVGQRIRIGSNLGPGLSNTPREIVGIVADTREDGLQLDPPPVMYMPQPQMSDTFTALTNSIVSTSWVVRTSADPMTLAARVRRNIAAIDPLQSGFDFAPLSDVIRNSLRLRHFILVLLMVFAGIALLLAALGVYGVISYSLQQRTQEIGIRLALGARGDQIMSLILRRGLILILLGVAIGLAAGASLSRVLRTLLFSVHPVDPLTFISSSVVLGGVAVLATWLPARRAARVDPKASLRWQ